MFDKASQASSISSGGLWGCRGGNEQIARGWIIASRERLIVLCRVEEQSAPEIRASATPRRGGGTAVPFYEGGGGGQPTDPKAGRRYAVRLTSSVCSFQWTVLKALET